MGLFSPAGSEVALNLESQALESLINVMSLTPKKGTVAQYTQGADFRGNIHLLKLIYELRLCTPSRKQEEKRAEKGDGKEIGTEEETAEKNYSLHSDCRPLFLEMYMK